MVKAFAKLGLIAGGCIILSIFAVVLLRWMGAQQSFLAPPHAWFERSFWWVYTPTADELCATRDLEALLPDKQWIVALPIEYRKDDRWYLPCTTPRLVTDFLASTAHADFLLRVRGHDTWGLDQLAETVGAFDKSKRFAVIGEAQKISVYLRKKAPQWLFAADSSSLLRFRMFESLGLETAMDFWPDFVVMEPGKAEAVNFDERAVRELERRKKRVLLQWTEGSPTESAIPYQGIMTNRPSAAQQKFGPRL